MKKRKPCASSFQFRVQRYNKQMENAKKNGKDFGAAATKPEKHEDSSVFYENDWREKQNSFITKQILNERKYKN
ncbi:MAG: hypothetical protein LBR34_04210 [Prevotella sp.]|jgi:hypothetical protein|nr:hypothetical protein [Prevotella sp.]